MKLNILLVYPEFPDIFWSFKHALKFVQKKAGVPPLGMLGRDDVISFLHAMSEFSRH